MAKKQDKFYTSMREVLETFDLKKFKSWMRKNQPMLWKQFKKASETVQMATMCKMICNRTDMLNTEAHKKAVIWLKEHDMKGRLF